MEKQNIPQLRFPEFSGEWEEKNLGKTSKFFSGGTPLTTKPEFYNGDIPFIKSGEINSKNTSQYISKEGLNNSSAKKVEKGDVLFALYGATSGEVALSQINGAINQAVLCIRPTDQKVFLYYQLYKNKHRIIATYLQGGQGNLSAEIIKNLNLNFPSLPEQQKIASFLSAVDKKIEQLQKKKELLEQYKKGMMQKLFSREIRFKDEDGKEFPEWEEKKLGEIGATYTGLTGKSKQNFGTGIPYIQYKQIFDSGKINIYKCGYVEITEKESQNKVQFGDIFFTTSSETPNEIGTSSVLLDEVGEMYLNSFCFGYRANSTELKPSFAQFLFRSPILRIEMVKLAQGSTRYNMSKSELLKMVVMLPEVKEQTKIANFLTAIDDKIALTNKELDGAKTFKKGLLQHMFV